MTCDRRRTLGALGERHAESLLQASGYRILERNFRTREGELLLTSRQDGWIRMLTQ